MENRQHSAGGVAMPQPSDVATLRQRARPSVRRARPWGGRSTQRSALLHLLNAALATEIVCTLRYRRHYFMTVGLVAESVRQELLTRGFSVEISHGGPDKFHWLCLAIREMLPRHAELRRLRSELTRLARDAGGEYDGWETQAMR